MKIARWIAVQPVWPATTQRGSGSAGDWGAAAGWRRQRVHALCDTIGDVRGFNGEVYAIIEDHSPTLAAPPSPGAADAWALFLDVDGTLLDIAPRPDEVEVAPALQKDLTRMHAHLDGAVALLSGRPLAQIDALLGWRGRVAAGLHGAELRTPDGHESTSGNAQEFLQLRERAVEMLATTRGVMLEDKRRALALHFRSAADSGVAAERIAHALIAGSAGRYELQRGDHVFELKPAGVDKGRALATLLSCEPFRGRTPWMLGDDLTDEDAFRRVNASAGVSVIVGQRRPTIARHALADPAAVRAWLHAVALRFPLST